MPDSSGLTPPYLDPSLYPDYLDAQRKSMMASMLLNSMQTGNQTPPDWDSMRVVPKRGLMQNLSPIIKALMAGNMMKGAQQAQAQYYSSLYGGQPSQGAQSADPNEQTVQPIVPRNGQSFSQAGAGPQPQQNPMLLTGDPRTSQALIGMMGPQEYAKSLAARYQPTDLDKKLNAAGITDPGLRRQIVQANLAKENYIAPVNARPGGTILDPLTGQPTFTAPQNGVYTTWGPNGPQATTVPGAQEAAARQEALSTAAKVGNTPQTFPTAGGGSTVGYPGDVIGQPPATRAQAPVAPPTPAPNAASPHAAIPVLGKSYFPQQEPLEGAWATMPKLPVSKSLGAPDAFTEGRLKAAGAKDAELSSQYGKEADLADQKLQYNLEARKALPHAETGPMSEWMTENRAKLLEWGVPESMVPGSDKITPTMELNKNLKQSALQGARAIFGSRMTQMEVRLQHEELSPSPSMTKDAIRSLMQQDDIKQMYAKQRSEDYGKYIHNGGDPLRFESWYAKTFPLTKFAEQQLNGKPGPIEKKGFSREQLEDELRKRGYLK
jgi:hypothetical protein